MLVIQEDTEGLEDTESAPLEVALLAVEKEAEEQPEFETLGMVEAAPEGESVERGQGVGMAVGEGLSPGLCVAVKSCEAVMHCVLDVIPEREMHAVEVSEVEAVPVGDCSRLGEAEAL